MSKICRTLIISSNINIRSDKVGGCAKMSSAIYARYMKRCLDIVIPLAVLILFWWVYVLLAVLVRLNLGTPVIFTQERPGKDGKIFKLYKFRSMSNAKDKDGNLLPDRDRLNGFGRFLRSTSLDELPELFNLLKGDMSLIGPRPLLVKYLGHYNSFENRRHEVRPGMTGLAQVSGRNAAAWKERFRKDIEYVDHISFSLDVKIFFLTIKKIFAREGIEYQGTGTIMDYFESKDRIKALVLCGGIPQAALIEELKSRGIFTVLADKNPNAMARPYADAFFPVSALDAVAVKKLAVEEKADMVLTACADQVLLVQAQVSEELGLPCYIDYKTAKDVSSKERMKKIFAENGIPTSKYAIMGEFDEGKVKWLEYPVIVKPVDSYSSRGVRKAFDIDELKAAFKAAVEISRTNTAIVEEFVEGEELTVDVYIEDGKAHTLCISNIDKIPGTDRFVICRTRYPAQITGETNREVKKVAEKIAKAFNLRNSPMLVQIITNGKGISVVEFCARTGGGDKFRLIKQVSHFDVIKAVVDLTLGKKPHVEPYQLPECIVNEFLYAEPGTFDHLEGFDEMKAKRVVSEYFQLKSKGTKCCDIKSSGDRVAYYTIQAPTIDEVREKERKANKRLKAIDAEGRDMLQHDLIGNY